MLGVKTSRIQAKGAGNRTLLPRIPFEEAGEAAGEAAGEVGGEAEVAAVTGEDDGNLRDRLVHDVATSKR